MRVIQYIYRPLLIIYLISVLFIGPLILITQQTILPESIISAAYFNYVGNHINYIKIDKCNYTCYNQYCLKKMYELFNKTIEGTNNTTYLSNGIVIYGNYGFFNRLISDLFSVIIIMYPFILLAVVLFANFKENKKNTSEILTSKQYNVYLFIKIISIFIFLITLVLILPIHNHYVWPENVLLTNLDKTSYWYYPFSFLYRCDNGFCNQCITYTCSWILYRSVGAYYTNNIKIVKQPSVWAALYISFIYFFLNVVLLIIQRKFNLKGLCDEDRFDYTLKCHENDI